MQVNLFPLLGLRLLRQKDMCHCQPQCKNPRRVGKKYKMETLFQTAPSLAVRDYLDTSICGYPTVILQRKFTPKPSEVGKTTNGYVETVPKLQFRR